jgi:putative hydrolase of the HAD superfamily
VTIRAVGFDLDGTLYPAWRMYALAGDLALMHPRIFWAYGRARRYLRKESGGNPFPEGWKARQAAFVARRLGIGEEKISGDIDRFVYAAMERRFSLLRSFQGLPSCLDRLASGGLKLGLLSDLPPGAKLKAMGLNDRFEVALCSEDFGVLKPAPAPFLALARAMDTEPGEMLYVGNNYDYDCRGAKALGMKTALRGLKKGKDADFSFLSWKSLADWILDQAKVS